MNRFIPFNQSTFIEFSLSLSNNLSISEVKDILINSSHTTDLLKIHFTSISIQQLPKRLASSSTLSSDNNLWWLIIVIQPLSILFIILLAICALKLYRKFQNK
jgi:hypothetical protein